MLAEIETYLTAQVPALKLVEGAAGFALLKKPPPTAKQPAAYVIPLSQRGQPNRSLGVHDQVVTEKFGVVLALGNLKDKRGETASQQMETIRTDVMNSLIGWIPVTGYSECEFANAQLLRAENSVIWWLVEFTTTTHLRKV